MIDKIDKFLEKHDLNEEKTATRYTRYHAKEIAELLSTLPLTVKKKDLVEKFMAFLESKVPQFNANIFRQTAIKMNKGTESEEE